MNREQKRQVLSVFFQPLRHLIKATPAGEPQPDDDALRRAIIFFCGTARFAEQILLLWLMNWDRLRRPDRVALATMFAPTDPEEVARFWLVAAIALSRSARDQVEIPFEQQLGRPERRVAEWLCQAALGRPLEEETAPDADDAALAQRLVVFSGQMLRMLGLVDAADAMAETWSARAETLKPTDGVMRLNDGHFLNVGHFVITAATAHFATTGRLGAARLEAEEGPVANGFLRDALRPFVGIADGPSEGMVETICGNRLVRFNDGSTLTSSRLISEAAAEWRARGEAFLTLDGAVIERGWKALEPYGLTPDKPLITLHVRESKWKADLGNFLRYGSRNADLSSYSDAIRHLADRGAQVVRLGDTTMAPAPAIEGLLDYPHSPLKSEWVDCFLVSQALFHVGTSSGMSLTPLMFNKPVLLTNWAAFDEMLDPPHAVTIFKVLRDMSGRAIPIAELSKGQGYLRTLMDGGVMGCFPDDNDAEDLLDATRFMADAVDWSTGAFTASEETFAASHAAFAASSFGITPRIAPGFWARHYG